MATDDITPSQLPVQSTIKGTDIIIVDDLTQSDPAQKVRQGTIDGLLAYINNNSSPTFVKQGTNYTITASDRGKVFLCTASITITLGATTSYPANFWVGIVNYIGSSSGVVTISTPDEISFTNTQLVLSNAQGVKIYPDSAGANWAILESANDGGVYTNIFNISADTVTLSDVHNRGFVRLSTSSSAKTVTLPVNTSDALWLGFDCEVYNPSNTAAATITGGTIEGVQVIGPLQSVRIIKRSFGLPNTWYVRGASTARYKSLVLSGLTTLDFPYSYVSISAVAGNTLKLFDATKAALNTIYYLVNTSSNSYTLALNDGTVLLTVQAYQSIQLILTDNSSAAGSFTYYVLPGLQSSINAQTGTTYTLAISDQGQKVTLNNASAITLNIPTNASVAFPRYTSIDLGQLGAGQVNLVPAGGVTLLSFASATHLAGPNAGATITLISSDTWWLVGNIV